MAKKYVPCTIRRVATNVTFRSAKGAGLKFGVVIKFVMPNGRMLAPSGTITLSYVFGNERPHTYSNAAWDVSPAIKTYMGMSGKDVTDWRFVEAYEVAPGPWLKYGEQAIIFTALKRQASQVH